MGFKQNQHNTGLRRYWPVLGFLMFVVLGIIAYFSAPAVQELTRDIFPQFRTSGVNREMVRLGYTAFILIVLMLLSGAIVAAMQPRAKVNVKDKDMLKMREALLQQKAAEKQRMRKVNRDMRGR